MEAMWEAINFILWKSQLVSIKHDRNEVAVGVDLAHKIRFIFSL